MTTSSGTSTYELLVRPSHQTGLLAPFPGPVLAATSVPLLSRTTVNFIPHLLPEDYASMAQGPGS